MYSPEVEYSEVTIDHAMFSMGCAKQHYIDDGNDSIDEVDLQRALVVGEKCDDYRPAKICKWCGKRGKDNNVWCPDCKQTFDN
jgi:hypothetical protein